MTSMYIEVADPWLTGKELFKTQRVHEFITQFFVSLQVWHEKVNTMPWNILYTIYIWKSEFNEKSVSHAHLVYRNHLRTHWAAACIKSEQRQTSQTARVMDKILKLYSKDGNALLSTMHLVTILLLDKDKIKNQVLTQQKLDETDVKLKHSPQQFDDCCRRMEFKFSSKLSF